MRYGFVIDQNRCIGCHACTVACKEEHDVPLSVNRTWVKYIEKGSFPATRRHFAVLRCNHCHDAPCVTICPTVALFKRHDGIVDFDPTRCIGCKSCMQACPYDALYIDPNTHTAAKCNFCAHRVESRLQPACEIVCPAQAIISGDLDDPTSRVSTIVATEKVTVRKPHKGTQPNLYYVGVDDDLLEPTRVRAESTHLWADKYPGEDDLAMSPGNGYAPPAGAREVYDVPHPQRWGPKIAAYLWTKSIGAGLLLVAAILMAAGLGDGGSLLHVVVPLAALGFTGLTLFLLVIDLKRPERFYYLLTKPNPRSWLVIGGYILMGYSLLAVAWLVLGATGAPIPSHVRIVTAALAIGAAGYTAFLFAQAKGRDLWQSPLFLWHLLLQALAAGAAVLLILAVTLNAPADLVAGTSRVLMVSLSLIAAVTLGEIWLTPVSEDMRRAHHVMVAGALRGRFWGVVIAGGIAAPVLLLLWSGAKSEPSGLLCASAALLSLWGLWVFEDLWVQTGQAMPLS